MGLLQSLLIKVGLADLNAGRAPLSVFLLDDDQRRHRWFKKRFSGDLMAIAENVEQAKKVLLKDSFEAIFLDHDLLPEHYESSQRDDENTGYAIARWLGENKKIQSGATIIIHTRNETGGMRMVEVLREHGRAADYVPFNLLDTKIKHLWKK